MSQNRRNFIRGFGATLGSLIVSGSLPGCGPTNDAETKKDEVKTEDKPPSNTVSFSAPEWGQLRQSWLSLANPDSQSALSNRFWESVKKSGDFAIAEDAFVKQHQAFLDALVAAGQLEKPVAGLMQTALEEAVVHIVYSASMCYYAIPIDHRFRKDLLQQVDVLQRIAGDVDPATVAKSRAAIVKDMAFFERFSEFKRDHAKPRARQHEADDQEASPDALEAARLLARLFVETPD